MSCCSSVAWGQSQDDLVKDRLLFIPFNKILSLLAIGFVVTVRGEIPSRWLSEGIAMKRNSFAPAIASGVLFQIFPR